MKKILLLLVILNLFQKSTINAQSPQSFKYQSVVRDATGARRAESKQLAADFLGLSLHGGARMRLVIIWLRHFETMSRF